MKPYYQDKWLTIYYGDCREILPQLDKGSAIVTDPPYELGFMGKSWDSKGISFQKETWGIIRNSCLPGAPLLSFGGTRTFHRIACAIEDAGWEIRDTVMWVYGSGFPKSLDISKAIDKQFGAEREVIGKPSHLHPGRVYRVDKGWNNNNLVDCEDVVLTAPSTPEAQLWEGYGTALKPAYEPIILAMNPLDGTFANNALKHGVAGLNIDECRIPISDIKDGNHRDSAWSNHQQSKTFHGDKYRDLSGITPPKGRFPANFIHDGSQMVMELFPKARSAGNYPTTFNDSDGGYGNWAGKAHQGPLYNDNGSAARFFYCAKASKAERDKGCEGLPLKDAGIGDPRPSGQSYQRLDGREPKIAHNNHPTVKPLALMTYLVKLVKMPEYNLILDPFMGSGTTLLACIRLGIPCIGIDNDEKSCEIAAKRCCQEVMELV